MRYIKPHYYDTFECLAGKCPATCCAGWQIMIDEESLNRYEAEKERLVFGFAILLTGRKEAFINTSGAAHF